jgi:hypothetical protein
MLKSVSGCLDSLKQVLNFLKKVVTQSCAKKVQSFAKIY